jgi:hypothetical protein
LSSFWYFIFRYIPSKYSFSISFSENLSISIIYEKAVFIIVSITSNFYPSNLINVNSYSTSPSPYTGANTIHPSLKALYASSSN